MTSDRLIALLKLGERQYMEELLLEGHVFMNTVEYFAKLDASSSRCDRDEGTGYCKNAGGAILKMEHEGDWQTLGTLSGAIRFHEKGLAATNIYSLHGKTESDYGTVFELKNLGLGDAYVLFFDANEFLRRLERGLANMDRRLSWRKVEYVDRRSYTGPMGEFRKFKEKSAEQEVRIAVQPGSGEPLSLRLGNLSDIAVVGSTEERLLLEPKVPSAHQA